MKNFENFEILKNFENFENFENWKKLKFARSPCADPAGIEVWAVQKHVNLVDLVKGFPTSIYYLIAKNDFDTAQNEPLKVYQQLAKRYKKLS